MDTATRRERVLGEARDLLARTDELLADLPERRARNGLERVLARRRRREPEPEPKPEPRREVHQPQGQATMDEATQKRWNAWADARISKGLNKLMGDLAEPIGQAIAEAERRIREKHSADLAELRLENARLLMRVLALEAGDKPSEGTVLDMRSALRRSAA